MRKRGNPVEVTAFARTSGPRMTDGESIQNGAIPRWPRCEWQACSHRSGELDVLERHCTHPRARGRKHGVGDRGRGSGRAELADAAPFLAAREREVDLDLRGVGQPNNLIAVEIALFDLGVLDRDLAIQGGGKSVHHPALNLRFDDAGIDHVAAIDGGDNAVDLDLAFLADGDLGDLADYRAIALVDCYAAPASLAQRFTPVAFLGDGVEHAKEIRFPRQQRAPEFVGVLSRGMRQLVDIALDKERILRRANRAPE